MFFFFNDTATTEIYTLSLHDALPICRHGGGHGHVGRREADHVVLERQHRVVGGGAEVARVPHCRDADAVRRSEEHTSELQSQSNLVCRLLLEKKKKNTQSRRSTHILC